MAFLDADADDHQVLGEVLPVGIVDVLHRVGLEHGDQWP